MYKLYAAFPDQKVCQDRQEAGLWRWSAYIIAQAVPTTKPDKSWVQQRIVASRIPGQTMQYVQQTIGYTIQQPDIQTNARQHMAAFNDDTVEAAMDQQVDGAMAVFMPVFCATSVADADVERWYEDNGFSTKR